jgi:hypothetical protein
MKGPKVGDLQNALQLLLDRDRLLTDDEGTRRELSATLKRERAAQTYGTGTRDLVRIFQKERRLKASGTVDEPTAKALNRLLEELRGLEGRGPAYAVKGTVRFFDGFPAAGVTVAAYDRDLRSEQVLGKSQTDNQGLYRIQYSEPQFHKAEKSNADLVVKAFAADGSLLATSPVLFNAAPVAELDLTIAPELLLPPTLFERIEQALKPVLNRLKVEELEEDKEHQDLSFLSGESGFEKQTLARFVLAHRLADQRLPAEFWFVLLGGSFYQFTQDQSIKEQLVVVFDALPSLDAIAVHKALIRGFNQKEIHESARKNTEGWVEAFLNLIATRALTDSKGATFVKSALEHAGITNAKKQATFARLFNEHKSLTPELLKTLEKDGSFENSEVADLRSSFQLAELTQGDFAVVKMIKDEFGIRQPEQVRTLAKRSEDEWVKLVRAKHAAGEIKLPIEVGAIAGRLKLPEAEVYGKMLERQLREAFPTAAFAGGLERSLQNGGAHGLRQPEMLGKFLARHENFELLNTPVDEFLNKNTHSDFRALAKDETFRQEVKAVQRVFKLAPTFEATDALLADDLHSAQKVYRLGESEFVRRYADRPGFTRETARLAWSRAADTHAAVLTVVADLKGLEAEALPLALRNNSEALANFPNWNNLFKTGDLCECEHCRSVLSPAAYFADLVMFLKDRKAKNGAQSVKDVLFGRRPDLGYLELNCENALTPLPYIDAVCEVLEDVVAGDENDLELPAFTTIPADATAAKNAVATAFAAQNINLGADFSLSQVNAADPDRWVAHGNDVTFLLKKKATPNFFAEILRNTKASAAEMRSYPQYVYPKAYDKLKEAKYPLSLPFDLFAEEVRATFQKSNLNRWDLMRTLRSSTPPSNPNEGDIAAEYFGISADPTAAFDEKRLILVADATVAGQQLAWGETTADWLDTVGNVKSFLQKTSLEYNDLLVLLDLKFINPEGDIVVHHLDPSCDTDKKVIQGLDAAKLDRIHRFLRLWRKLKDWRLWELDLVLRHPLIGAITNPTGALDEQFLINLFYFSQLRRRLGGKTTVEQVSALFGDLNTETRFTKLHEKREDALYQNLFLNKRLINPLDPAFQPDPGTGDLPAGETITAHHPVLLSALGIRATDLILLKGLTKSSDGTPYISDDLTLSNLSFLWRHAWLSKVLKFNVDEWKIILKILQQHILHFSTPEAAWKFVEGIDHLRAAGFTPDELNWLLAADRGAKAATKETDAARFLVALRKELQRIRDEFDPSQYDFLSVTPPTDVEGLSSLLVSLLQKLNRDESAIQVCIETLNNEIRLESKVAGLPQGFDFPPTIKTAIRIRYDEAATTLRFTGLMTAAQRTTLLNDPSLAAVTSVTSYKEAIEDFFSKPRLAVKFFEPVFTAPLTRLPASADFRTLSDKALIPKISYDAEQRVLRFAGIPSKDEKTALDALSSDAAYLSALNSIANQPQEIVPPDGRIWLTDNDLDSAQPATDTVAKRLANATRKLLDYLSKKLTANAVVQQSSAKLGLTEALTRRLLTHYEPLPDTMLTHLTVAFTNTTSAVDYATHKTTFEGWFWLRRAAAILKKWKVTLAELEKITALTAAAQLLDLQTLPLDNTGAIASIDRFLRTSRLLRMRDSLPETEITFLEVLEKLDGGSYATAADFAADIERVNNAWLAADVLALIESLNLAYPADYLLAESWERMRRAFYFIDNLRAGADVATTFAATAMTASQAKTLKELLRSKFGSETWLTLSAEIQDVLRERKRDALAAYLLTQPPPADAPSGKWENTNDLYAYYLLDVEMCSCQLTSRLVQGSGSIQLFVQRCFMGLEPDVEVKADGDDGDSAWRWWQWMRKYRLWEANRKVFLWPENWIEPELKKDRSPFFKDLENELQQNEVNQFTAETALSNYLEKLDGVAQLQIAGFYQEDDADDTILHVFGRTSGTEPHLYYYRRFDYRQWTSWEKVDLDIQSDYLIPAVVNKRLFLFWPVFTEVPDETGNSAVSTPDIKQANVAVQKSAKRLRLQLAVSDYRQGRWTPKRVSKDFDQSELPYTAAEIINKNYRFFPFDRSDIDGRFGVLFDGFSAPTSMPHPPGSTYPYMSGAFEIAGCKGVPDLRGELYSHFSPAVRVEVASTGELPSFMKWAELGANPGESRLDQPQNDLTLQHQFPQASQFSFTPVLMQTPWFFKLSPPWHASYFDRLLLNAPIVNGTSLETFSRLGRVVAFGSWLPFFYNDKKRTFMVLPGINVPRLDGLTIIGGSNRYYYPELKAIFQRMEDDFEEQINTWLESFDLSTLNFDQRQQVERLLSQAFPEEALPPYADAQVKNLLQRWFMRFVHSMLGARSLHIFQFRQFHFKNFYHPFVCDFAKMISNPLKGVPALMSRVTQLQNSGFSFKQSYVPTQWVVDPTSEEWYPKEVVDFTPDGAYSPYNWELFFHVPLFIANSLSNNQRFEEARNWYHFIFNPIGIEGPVPGGSPMSKYWITKPFFETTDPQYVQQRIDNILRMLAGDTGLPGSSTQTKDDLEGQVRDWRSNPFEPHRIANYRTVAYQKTVVMKYLDNLIAWGDNLFRQDSMESINEATQLYVLAAEILGPGPKRIPPQAKPPLESFNELENALDDFSNALVEIENLVPPLPGNGPVGGDSAPLPMLYFCVPQNDKLLGYWDTVADRLHKVRHCMNIEGVVRQLALFEPPIDPGALVKAVAGGVDLNSAFSDLNAPLPLYRFNVLLQKANELCNDVKALGGALLSALEKKDTEALGLLRQSHEIRLLDEIKAVREKQIEEAKANLSGLQTSKQLAEIKKQYYESRSFMNAGEKAAISLNTASTLLDISVSVGYIHAGVLKAIPNFVVGANGFGGSPLASTESGGGPFGDAAKLAIDGLAHIARNLDKMADLSNTIGSYSRRKDEWDFQRDQALKEIEQIDQSIAAAELRVAIAEKELENHILQIENAKGIDAFMRSKYTNEELYDWQVGQISGVYFQSYQLAYDLAKRAERCFRFELGLQESSYINFGYWDSLKKGLLSGERLQYDLRRLEAAYLDDNRREFELVKHVSLGMVDPLALVQLRETGRCFFRLPEEIFDLDFPGHYFRRVKSISVSLPCVAGPYTSVSCTLRLLKSSVRINTGDNNGYPRNTDEEGVPLEDDRFVENNIPVNAIATSSGENDSGVFELSFRDERYLPFEGAGAISDWSLELFSDLPPNNPDPANPDFGKPLRQFDYSTVSDAILHVKYTAREEAGIFKDRAISNLRTYFSQAGSTPSLRMLNLRQEFPTQWHRFLHPADSTNGNIFELDLSPSHFRILDAEKTLKVNRISLLARCTDSGSYDVVLTPLLPAPPGIGLPPITLSPLPHYGGLHVGEQDVELDVAVSPEKPPVKWRLKMTRPGGENLRVDPVDVEDLLLVAGYQWE